MPIRVQIDGVGTVELDDGFRAKTPAEQNAIIANITRQAPKQSLPHNMARGGNVGIANFLGAPVDLITSGVNSIADDVMGRGQPSLPGPLGIGRIPIGPVREPSQPFVTNPVGGSQSIKNAMNWLGQQLGSGDKALAYDDISEIPSQHRPFAVAAETFTGSLAPGAAGMKALQTAERVPQFLKPMADYAKRNPRAFAAAEMAGSSGAAQGAAIAEIAAPSDPTARMGAEIAGGFMSPSSLMTRAYRLLSGAGKQTVGRMLPSFTRSGSESEAANIVQRVVRDAGEDPAALSRTLFAADPNKLNLTSGQQSGSKALLNLEAKLAGSRPGVGAEADTRKVTALSQLRESADVLAATGNPGALRAATALRKRYFDDLMDARINTALRDAQDAREGITRGGGTSSAMDASSEATGVLERAYDEARAIERQMWSVVPSDKPANVNNVLKTYQRTRSELLPNDKLREPIEGYMRILTKENPRETMTVEYDDGTVRQIGGGGDYQPTTGDLKNLRSRALSLERQAAQQGDRTTERHMGMMARAALEDLTALDLPGLAEARQYSSSMHDSFTKTFADEVLSVTREGADRIPPQLALERAYGSGGAGANVRFQELRGAARFPETISSETAPAMTNAQERYMRTQVGRMAHPESGAFDPNQLQRFSAENAPTLAGFPELRGEIETLTGAERTLSRTRAVAGSRQEKVSKVLGAVLRSEDPARTVGDALRGRNPTRDFTSLANIARKGGGVEALSGLRSATLQNALDTATTQAGKFSFQRLNATLMDPLPGNREGLLGLMQRTGTITPDTANRLRTLIDRGVALENAIGDDRAIEKLYRAPDAALDLAARIMGARVGAKLASGPGSVLVGAARGSRTARDIMQKLPLSMVSNVLVEAVENPKLMSALLAKPRSVGEQRALGQIIHGFLVNAGINVAAEDEPERTNAR